MYFVFLRRKIGPGRLSASFPVDWPSFAKYSVLSLAKEARPTLSYFHCFILDLSDCWSQDLSNPDDSAICSLRVKLNRQLQNQMIFYVVFIFVLYYSCFMFRPILNMFYQREMQQIRFFTSELTNFLKLSNIYCKYL